MHFECLEITSSKASLLPLNVLEKKGEKKEEPAGFCSSDKTSGLGLHATKNSLLPIITQFAQNFNQKQGWSGYTGI